MRLSKLDLPLRTTLLYLLFGGLWILASDRVLSMLVPDQTQQAVLQTFKGWFFILVSGGLLYYLLRRGLNERKQVEEQLTYQAELFFNIHDAAIGTDENLKVNYWNKAAEEMFGWTRDEVLGREIGELLKAPIPESSRTEAIRELLAVGRYDNEILYSRKDGRYIITHARAIALKNPRAEFKGLVTIISDITERKRAEEALRASEEQFRTLFQNVPVGIGVADLQGNLMIFNDAMLLPGQYTRSDIEELGNVAALYYDAQERQAALVLFQQQGYLRGYELQFRRKDGTPYNASLSLTQTIFNRQPAILAMVEDITERKQAELETQRLTLELILLDKVRTVLSRELELSTLMRAVVESIKETLGYTHVSLYFLKGEVLALQYQIGYEHIIEDISIAQGISGRVVRSGKPMMVEDVRNDSDFLAAVENITSEICVPLFDNNIVVGILNVESTNGKKLTEADLTLMVALAEHIDVAIGRARIYNDLQRRNLTLSALQEATLALMKQLELSNVLQAIITQAAQLMDVPHGYIYLVEPDGEVMQIRQGLGKFTTYIGQKLKIGEGLAGKVWQTAQPLNITDYHTWAGRAAQFEEAEFHAVMGVPLISGSRVVGVLGLAHLELERAFSPDDVNLLNRFAQLASIAFENARLYTLGRQELAERKVAEAALNEGRARLAGIIDSAMDAIISLNANQRIILFNPAAEQMFGCFAAEALGQPLDRFIPERLREAHREHIRRFSETGQTNRSMGRSIMLTCLRANGEEFPAEISISQIEMAGQKIYTAILRDVTARKQAEEALREAEEKYRGIFENVVEGIHQTTPEGRYLAVNPAAAHMLGYDSPEELIATMTDLDHSFYVEPDRRAQFKQALEQSDTVTGFESQVFRKDGSIIWVSENGRAVHDKRGRLLYYEGTSEDITARKQAEGALREQQIRQQKILDTMFAFVGLFSPDGIVLEANRAPLEAAGLRTEDVIGKSFADVYWWSHSEITQTQVREAIRRAASGETVRDDFLVRILGGQLITVDAVFGPLRDSSGSIVQVIGSGVDVTERKRAEEKLAQQNQRLTILREIDTAILAADSIENIVGAALDYIRELIDCERANLALIEWEKNEAVNFDVRDSKESAISKGARVSLDLIQDIMQVLSKNQPVIMDDLTTLPDPPPQIKIFIKEGLRSRCILPLFSHGKLIGSFTLSSKIPGYFDEEKINLGREVANQVAIAITQNNLYEELRRINADLEQRVAERTEALSQANTLLQAMMDNVPDQLYFKDIHSRFIRNSRSQANMLGLSDPSEVVGKSDFNFFPHAQRAYDEEQEVMRSGQPLVDYEEHVVWPDGQVTWVSTTKAPLRNQEGEIIGIFGISRDITNRKKAEEALRKAKEETETANKELDAFSYSVSHDLRAPLRAIDGYAHILAQEYGALLPDDAQHYLNNILDGSKRMGELIHDLLMLSRVTRQVLKRENVDLSNMARAIVADLSSTAPQRQVEFVIADGLAVYGDAGLLQIVMENLLNNAWKYTSKRAQASIEFGFTQIEGNKVFFVRDNGAGFDMAHAASLFGTFQRLHPESEFEGTGVGLATVQRIIQRHSGRIWAEAEVDKGATFYFTLG